MVNRLKICLQEVISDKQITFVEGRLLTDKVLIAFELNYYIQRKLQGVNGVVGFKIDVFNAYDRIEWVFLDNMLNKFGFNTVWTDIIMAYVKTVS